METNEITLGKRVLVTERPPELPELERWQEQAVHDSGMKREDSAPALHP